MRFNHLIIYQLKDAHLLSAEALKMALAEVQFQPCLPSQKESFGFVAPFEEETQFYEVHDHFLLKFKKETKLLPPAVIKTALQEKIIAFEEKQGKKATKTEKTELKEQVLLELLPRAFSRFSHYAVWVDKAKQRLMINAASFNAAELILSTLRKALGSLSAVPLSAESNIEQKMTDWVLDPALMKGFYLGEEAKLIDVADRQSTIQFKKESLADEQVHAFLNQGKRVYQLALQNESVSFLLHQDLTLKRLQFPPEVFDGKLDLPQNPQEKQKADFLLSAQMLRALLDHLLSIL